MPHRLTRERMVEAIRDLPEDASVDDAIERLVFLGRTYFRLTFADRDFTMPGVEPLVYVGAPGGLVAAPFGARVAPSA
jgi:hypothetical protein